MTRRSTALMVAGCLVTAPAIAASLSFSPVGLDLPVGQKAAAITLTNNATAPVSLQIRVYKWAQADGRDVLTPTRDVIASPPAAKVPGGAAYTIRILRQTATPTPESYRLMIDELPRPIDPNAGPQGVSMLLRTSLPIFFTPDKAVAHIQWKLWSDAAGLHLEGRNDGQRHIRLADLAVETAQGRLAFGTGLSGYILPGATRRFDAKPGPAAPPLAPGSEATVTARTGAADLKDPVRVGTP